MGCMHGAAAGAADDHARGVAFGHLTDRGRIEGVERMQNRTRNMRFGEFLGRPDVEQQRLTPVAFHIFGSLQNLPFHLS